MNKKSMVAIAIATGLIGASSSMAAPTYPPVPGNNGPEVRAIVTFSNASSAVKSSFLFKLSELVISKKSVVTITGYTNKTGNTKTDNAIALQRAKNTQKMLAGIAPKITYKVVSKGSTYNASCKTVNNRCVIVTVTN